jgi:hypothetical protein
MRAMAASVIVMLCFVAESPAQQPAAPQTARQALLEMFFGKEPGMFVKHLPMATRNALEKSGALASLQQWSEMMSHMQTQGQNVQTFETGSVLLSTENPKAEQKIEVIVENDSLRGDQDDIELSFQTYKNGKAQPNPFMSRLTFSMKQESQIWKLNEISVTVHVPLADPDFLNAITEKMKPAQLSMDNGSPSPSPPPAPAPAVTDQQVLAAMRTILTAEVTYAAAYPRTGFTCTLSDLDGFGGGTPNEHQAMLISSSLAGGKRYGYNFSLAGCGASPATSFQLTAAPNKNTFGRKAFCADQSGAIRSSSDGSAATCVAGGTPVE